MTWPSPARATRATGSRSSTFFSLERSTYCTIHYLLHTVSDTRHGVLSGVASADMLKSNLYSFSEHFPPLYDKGDIFARRLQCAFST